MGVRLFFLCSHPSHVKVKPPGVGGTPWYIWGDSVQEGTLSKRGTFFRLHVNERVRILLVEVYFKGRGICHFHHKKAQMD